MKKTYCLLFCLIICNVLQAQPGDIHGRRIAEAWRHLKVINDSISKFPNEISLYETKQELCSIVGDYDVANETINFLLSKDSKNAKYILIKANLLLNGNPFNREESDLDLSLFYFKKYFPLEKRDFYRDSEIEKVINHLVYKKKYKRALRFIEYGMREFYKGKTVKSIKNIIKKKIEVYNALQKHEEAEILIEKLYGINSTHAINHNLTYIKDYRKVETKIKDWLKTYLKDDVYTFEYKRSQRWSRYIKYLSYVNYKLGNKEEAVRLLFELTSFYYDNETYRVDASQLYWELFIGLDKEFKNDYRLHFINSYIFNEEEREITDMKHNKGLKFKPSFINEIPFISWNNLELEIQKIALKELEKAEELSGKKYDVLKSRIFYEMKGYEKSLLFANKAIEKKENKCNAYYQKYILFEYKMEDELNAEKFNKKVKETCSKKVFKIKLR